MTIAVMNSYIYELVSSLVYREAIKVIFKARYLQTLKDYSAI